MNCFWGLWKRHSTRHATKLLSQRNLRSKVRWFTELCNSHYVSQFAAFFIDTRAERSTVESRQTFMFVLVLELVFGLGFYVGFEVSKWIEDNKKVHGLFCLWGIHVNDPSAGSPTETLLRLLLPLNGKVWTTSLDKGCQRTGIQRVIRRSHRTIQSVGATGGVYKGQGRNQRELMTHTY